MTSALISTPAAAAEQLQDRRWIDTEFMYKPRPTAPRERCVFDFTLTSRLRELSRMDSPAVVLICDSTTTADSLSSLPGMFPRLRFVYVQTNPEPVTGADPYADTPFRCAWEIPNRWRRYALTDRWTRILFALRLVRGLTQPGYLIMPAHDAVWGRGLLRRLQHFSEQHRRRDLPAAVSPATPYHHSRVPGAAIPPAIIDALNSAFARDSSLAARLQTDHYQAFWGKTGLLPFALAGAVADQVETMVWEDDLEIDRVLRQSGYGVRALWIDRSALYRQALPVFDRAGLRKVLERTLHYSLNIPGAIYGASSLLNQPLDAPAEHRRSAEPRFARAVALVDALMTDINAEVAERMARCGLSWVDWGAYRYVACVGDPLVQVWKMEM